MKTLEIRHKMNVKGSYIKSDVIRQLMDIINVYISSNTTLNYHSLELDDDSTITIPNDNLTNIKETINDKIKQLKSYLEHNIDYDTFSLTAKSILSSILRYNINWNNIIYIKTDKTNVSIRLLKPNIIPLKIETHKYNDNSTIVELKNRYVNDGIIIVDLCKPYEDFNYGYNSLHFYEHITCTPWFQKIGFKNKNDALIYTNGFTSSLGHCYVYAIVKDKSTFENYLYSMIRWICESRSLTFWERNKEHLKREMLRTISETKQQESFSSFARSSGDVYNTNVNKLAYISCLKYWSNQPFKLFLRHPFDLTIDDDKIQTFINDNILNSVKSPQIETFNYFPYESLIFDKSFITKKLTKSDVAKIHYDYFEKDVLSDGLYGIDVSCRIFDKSKYLKISKNVKLFNYYPVFVMSTLKDEFKVEQWLELVTYLNMKFYKNETLLQEQYVTDN